MPERKHIQARAWELLREAGLKSSCRTSLSAKRKEFGIGFKDGGKESQFERFDTVLATLRSEYPDWRVAHRAYSIERMLGF